VGGAAVIDEVRLWFGEKPLTAEDAERFRGERRENLYHEGHYGGTKDTKETINGIGRTV
jgi:hypothetical protein